MTNNCKNCNHKLVGNFCNNCGQAANTHDINFKSIIYEIQHSIFHIDKGILYTTKSLLLRPGKTVRDYLNGKRVKHFKPFAYILVLSTIYALLVKISHKSTFIEEFFIGITEEGSEGSQTQFNLFIEILLWMKNHYAYTTLLLLPIISLASYFAFYKSRRNYFQHLILNSFAAGQRTAFYLLLMPFVYFVSDQDTNDIIENIKIIVGIGLTFWFYFQFFNSLQPLRRIAMIIIFYILLGLFVFALILILFSISRFLI